MIKLAEMKLRRINATIESCNILLTDLSDKTKTALKDGLPEDRLNIILSSLSIVESQLEHTVSLLCPLDPPEMIELRAPEGFLPYSDGTWK